MTSGLTAAWTANAWEKVRAYGSGLPLKKHPINFYFASNRVAIPFTAFTACPSFWTRTTLRSKELGIPGPKQEREEIKILGA